MSEEKKRTRTMGANFPHSEEGDYLYDVVSFEAVEKERSNSWVIYQLIKEHYMPLLDDFRPRMEIAKAANGDVLKRSKRGRKKKIVEKEVEAKPDVVPEKSDTTKEDDMFPSPAKAVPQDPDFNLHS